MPEVPLLSSALPSPKENLNDVSEPTTSISTMPNEQRHLTTPSFVDEDGKDTTQLLALVHFKTVFAAMCFSEFIRAIDSVVLPVILPGIIQDLSASSSEGYLSGSAFLLFGTVSQPVYKGLAGAFGDKSCVLVALMMFATASILSGAAKNPEWLIAGRSVRCFSA